MMRVMGGGGAGGEGLAGEGGAMQWARGQGGGACSWVGSCLSCTGLH